jgi:phosphoglycerate kinase
VKTLKDFNFRDKRVLVRCDFNVPLDEEGEVLDDFRIRQAIPTVEYLIKERARVILMSHLDDPKGQIIENLRLTKIKEKLEEFLKRPVVKVLDCVGEEVEKVVADMQGGEVLTLENLRFHKEEEENDQVFAKELAGVGEIYINEAFSCSHRAHVSIAGVPQYLPSAAGLLLEKEINALTELMESPKRPLVAMVGGKKVETKSKIIDKISEVADWIIVGGLLKKEIEEKNLQFKYSQKIIGPLCQLDAPDIDSKTIEFFKEKIFKAKTVFWNGPFGRIEDEEFQKGTEEIAKAIINSGATSIVGGGETVEFINKIGLMDKFTHVSTGGGAMLAFLGGEKLPGLEALK